MTGMDTWMLIAPIIVKHFEYLDPKDFGEVYSNVFFGLQKLDEVRKDENRTKPKRSHVGYPFVGESCNGNGRANRY